MLCVEFGVAGNPPFPPPTYTHTPKPREKFDFRGSAKYILLNSLSYVFCNIVILLNRLKGSRMEHAIMHYFYCLLNCSCLSSVSWVR